MIRINPVKISLGLIFVTIASFYIFRYVRLYISKGLRKKTPSVSFSEYVYVIGITTLCTGDTGQH